MPNTPHAQQDGSSQVKKNLPNVRKTTPNKTSARKRAEKQQKPRPSLSHPNQHPQFEDVDLSVGNKHITLTRRHFLYGALGAGAAALMASGAVLSDVEDKKNAGISIEKRHVMDLDDLKEVDRDDCFTMVGDYDLPFGTLVWANSEELATCLVPTSEPSPLAQIEILLLGSGESYTVLENAIAASDGYEILDARASFRGLIWIESNIMEKRWRVMCAPMSSALALGSPRVLEEGGSSIETPSIAAVNDFAYWQVMPSITNQEARVTPSMLKRSNFIGGTPQVLHDTTGRMACAICACQDGVAIASRNKEFHSAFDLIYFDGNSGKMLDSMTLPSGMTPNAIGYGPHGFSFCFDSIYNFGDGMSDLGTYTPLRSHSPGASYEDIDWFRFGRTPQTGPCWCANQWLMVKSTSAVCGVDLENKTYCSLDTASGCMDWGDCLASSDEGNVVVTAMQIDQVNASGETQHKTQVRVWMAN